MQSVLNTIRRAVATKVMTPLRPVRIRCTHTLSVIIINASQHKYMTSPPSWIGLLPAGHGVCSTTCLTCSDAKAAAFSHLQYQSKLQPLPNNIADVLRLCMHYFNAPYFNNPCSINRVNYSQPTAHWTQGDHASGMDLNHM